MLPKDFLIMTAICFPFVLFSSSVSMFSESIFLFSLAMPPFWKNFFTHVYVNTEVSLTLFSIYVNKIKWDRLWDNFHVKWVYLLKVLNGIQQGSNACHLIHGRLRQKQHELEVHLASIVKSNLKEANRKRNQTKDRRKAWVRKNSQ